MSDEFREHYHLSASRVSNIELRLAVVCFKLSPIARAIV
jgi:hypothetical protein